MAEIKAIGRRFFAKASMGVPLVLRTSDGGLPHMPHGGLDAGPIPMDFDSKTSRLRDLIWSAIRKARKTDEQVSSNQYRRRYLMGGLDPDLAVLNSMSKARRIQIQVDRETAQEQRELSLRARIARAMGGKPEEFE